MPNQDKIDSKNISTAYDASDMLDVHSLAESDMQWMNTAITHVQKEIKKLYLLAKNGTLLSQYHLSELMTHLDMYEYLADSRLKYHTREAEHYSKEWEEIKKGNHNA